MSIIRQHLKQRLDRARISRYERQVMSPRACVSAAQSTHVGRVAAGSVDYI